MTYYLAEEQLPMRADEQIEQSIPPYDGATTLGPWASDLWRRASDLIPLAFYIWTLSTGLRPRASGMGPWTSGLGPRANRSTTKKESLRISKTTNPSLAKIKQTHSTSLSESFKSLNTSFRIHWNLSDPQPGCSSTRSESGNNSFRIT